MKIQKKELAAKLNKIKGAVPKKTTVAALQGILVKEGYLTASNTKMTVRAKIGGMGSECFIIPDRAFDLISNLPDGEVDISVTAENAITIKADKIKNTYRTLEPWKFPLEAAIEEESELVIKADSCWNP